MSCVVPPLPSLPILGSDLSNSPVDGSVVGSLSGPRQEGGRANALAIRKSNGKFYDVASTERLDFMCQYRAPTPDLGSAGTMLPPRLPPTLSPSG